MIGSPSLQVSTPERGRYPFEGQGMEHSIGEGSLVRVGTPCDLQPGIATPLSVDLVLRQMAATMEEVFWLSTPDLQTLLYVNPAFERVWGQPCHAASQVPAAIFHTAHPEDRSRVIREFTRSGRSRWELEYRIVRPDGSIRWVTNKAHVVQDERGRIFMLAGVASDITHRKLSQKALIESHARFVTVLDSIDADVYVADMATHDILFVNRHMRESFGENLIGRKCWVALHKDSGPCERCSDPSLVGLDGDLLGSRSWEGKDPVTGRYYLHHERVIRWIDGRPVRMEMATDVTRLKDLEAESLRIQAQLQQTQKMEAIGTLAGGIAHDFNNILTAILGYTEIAFMEAAEASPLRRNLQEVLRAGKRARDLVKQILTFSRQTEHEIKPVSSRLIVKEALNLMRASLPSTIRIQQRLRSESIVMADPTQIHQIIVNLCTNAAYAMRNKGGKLCVDLEDVEPDQSFFSSHPELCPGMYQKLTIHDSGQGMSADAIPRIFEPFFTTKPRGEGTGMGLAVVLGIVKSHKGAIQVESAVGKGTTFHVFLPIIQHDEAEPELDQDPGLPTGHEHVLLVEDEEPLLELGKQMLRHLGYRVTARSTGSDAFKLFLRNPSRFDLVISDMTMPEMTGEQLAEKMLLVRRDLPIILCTGYNAWLSKESAQAIGIRELVMKPMAIRELAQTVRRVLDHGT